MAKKLKYPYQRWKAAQEGEDEFQNTGEIKKTGQLRGKRN